MRAIRLMLLLSLAACTTLFSDESTVTIYSGRGEALVGELLARASRETGVPLRVQYGSTPELVTRMVVEADQTQADLLFAQEITHFQPLVRRGMLARLPDDLSEGLDPRFIDQAHHWVGTSGRLRVLAVNAESVPPDARPRSLRDLAQPEYASKLAWAPQNAAFQAHVSALRALWGHDETARWLRQVHASGPRTFPKNAPIVQAVADGVVQMGWVNHYYLHQSRISNGAVVNHSFAEGDAGNVLLVAGIAVREGSPRVEGATRIVRWLLSEAVQESVAQSSWEYPARLGVPTHPDVAPLDPIGLADLDPDHLSDLAPARAMLRELGLL
ncbi:MAG: extracellular solute-binding protein [Deltaproteobacteria bacterium]|nr:MAG: extracellular solute-binding protein [Deltaproteobacteria bacterium]